MAVESTMLALGTPAPDFDLMDTVSGERIKLADVAGQKALVVIFLCNHCPYVKHVQDGLVAFGNDYAEDIPGRYDYYSVSGDEIHEVAVGPVHAGVIEPGHFRFNCIGERVLNLEIQLGYQHRGIETLIPQVAGKRLPPLAESIAGDTTVGHSLCRSDMFKKSPRMRPQ